MEVFNEECFLSISVSDQIIHCEDALCQIHLQSVRVWCFRVNITAVFLNDWFNTWESTTEIPKPQVG